MVTREGENRAGLKGLHMCIVRYALQNELSYVINGTSCLINVIAGCIAILPKAKVCSLVMIKGKLNLGEVQEAQKHAWLTPSPFFLLHRHGHGVVLETLNFGHAEAGN